MIRERRASANHLRITMLLILTLGLVNLTTGCAKRYQVVDGSETICVSKKSLDDLYATYELLINKCGK